MLAREKGSRRWIDFPNLTFFLLNPPVKAHEYISGTSLLTVQHSALDMLTPKTATNSLDELV
jgi:hypothetical protein